MVSHPHPSFAVLAPVALLLAGCHPGQEQQRAELDSLRKEFESLRLEVLDKEIEIGALQARVSVLESGDALVSTEDQGYGVANTLFGPFTVSVRTASPYLDGYKVKLRVGNLTNATFNGAKVRLGWGPAFDNKNYKAWEAAQKKREVSIVNRLASGSFTDFEVVLTPANADEIKTIKVGFEFDQLELRVR